MCSRYDSRPAAAVCHPLTGHPPLVTVSLLLCAPVLDVDRAQLDRAQLGSLPQLKSDGGGGPRWLPALLLMCLGVHAAGGRGLCRGGAGRQSHAATPSTGAFSQPGSCSESECPQRAWWKLCHLLRPSPRSHRMSLLPYCVDGGKHRSPGRNRGGGRAETHLSWGAWPVSL